MEEIWKDMVGLEERYEISSEGRVRTKERYVNHTRSKAGKRLIKSRIIKQYKQHNGYMNLVLMGDNGRKVNILTHRAVALAFLPNPNNLPVVDHIDTDKTNNKVSNLRWVTHSENVHNPISFDKMKKSCKRGEDNPLHYYKNHSFHSRGKEHYKAISVLQMDDDGNILREYPTVSEAARSFGSNIASNISYCCKGKRNKAFGYRWKYKNNI